MMMISKKVILCAVAISVAFSIILYSFADRGGNTGSPFNGLPLSQYIKQHMQIQGIDMHPAIPDRLQRLEAVLNKSQVRLSECFEYAKNQSEIHGLYLLIEIKNNQLFYSHPLSFARHDRIIAFLSNLLKRVQISDMKFYVDAWDSRYCQHVELPKSCVVPVFAHEADFNCHGILIPPRDTVNRAIYSECSRTPKIPWENRKALAIWRGSTTNTDWNMTNYKDTVRYRLVEKSFEYPDLLDAKLTSFVQSEDWELKELLIRQNYLSSSYTMRVRDLWKYKYLVVVDGNTNPDRMGCFMFSESVILRTPILGDETFYTRMKPGVHFIPIKQDLSDLASKIRWAIEHDEEAKKIALAASEFIRKHENTWTPEGAELYWVQLLQEYAVLYNKFS